MSRKVVLITGCGPNGIGTALAQEFHRRGHRVLATGRTRAELDPQLVDLGIDTFVLDVTSTDSIEAAVSTTRELTSGRLDILINNAGVLHILPFSDMPVSDLQRILNVNVVGVWAMTQAFLPMLLESQGIVTAAASINEVLCPPYLAAYNASKAAVEAMLRTIRRELAPLGVKVVIVKTGAVKSALADHTRTILPEGSLYESIREKIEARDYMDQPIFADADKYARDVADGLLRDRPKAVLWSGGLAFFAWLQTWLGWETMLDWVLKKGYGLDKARYQGETKKDQ